MTQLSILLRFYSILVGDCGCIDVQLGLSILLRFYSILNSSYVIGFTVTFNPIKVLFYLLGFKAGMARNSTFNPIKVLFYQSMGIVKGSVTVDFQSY